MTAVTPTSRPKSVHNCCVIEAFGGVKALLFMLSRCFLEFSVGVACVGAFVKGLSQISSFFLLTCPSNTDPLYGCKPSQFNSVAFNDAHRDMEDIFSS